VEAARAAVERLGKEQVHRDLEMREQWIALAREEPYSCGVGMRPCNGSGDLEAAWPTHELWHWKDADDLLGKYDRVLVSGGNRSGKTQFASKYLVRTMLEKKGARVVAFSMTSQSSIRDQQPAVYNYLPTQWRKPKKTKTTNVSYTVKNGFSESTFVLPNGSQCWFNHYSQQPDILEGMEADLIWFDELVPYSWVETAAFRLVTRRGKLLITATPITGWTNTLSAFQAGCKFLRGARAELLEENKVHVPGVPAGHMPYVAECIREDSAIIWFHTDFNPFQPSDSMEKALSSESSVQKKIRFYGWTEKTSGNYFPKFGKAHIVSPEDIPSQGTNYMVVDFASARAWFALWLRATEDGKLFIYRESPALKEFGEWALPGDKPGGIKGPAAESLGMGAGSYVREYLRQEGDENIFQRLIDSRAASASVAASDDDTLIDYCNDALGDREEEFEPASGKHIDEGIEIINEALDYDMEEPLTVANEPRLYISSDCGNLMESLKEYTPAGGGKNCYKDPCDCLRYLMMAAPMYHADETFAAVGGGSY
tara:strand:- start:1601 stop:3220 length:1620 start_codon:yes stop_codon:yes gene_type:complete